MLRSLFGPSKAEIWSQLSRQLGGRYEKGGLFKGGKVTLPHREWKVTLDDYAVHAAPVLLMFIRLRAPYENRDRFRFRIYRKSGFSALGKWLGVEDVEIGDPSFDDKFIIQGTPPSMVTRLLTNARIKALMECQRGILLELKDHQGWFGKRLPGGVDELYLRSAGTMYEVDRVRELFELFSTVLDELCLMGAAFA